MVGIGYHDWPPVLMGAECRLRLALLRQKVAASGAQKKSRPEAALILSCENAALCRIKYPESGHYPVWRLCCTPFQRFSPYL
jgi:hypothetical protein